MKHKKLNRDKVLPIVKTALKEDIGRGDITTNLLFPKDRQIKAVIVAEEKGIVAGLDVAALVFKSLDRRIVFKRLLNDGEEVARGKSLAYVRGSGKGILAAERTALNFLGRLSGIATQTNNFIKKIAPYDVKIMDTRKTTPNLRYLEKYAVRVGGGYNHRLGLYDQVLIKDNHFKAQSSKLKVKSLIELAKKRKPKGMKIEIEVKNLNEFKQALEMEPDIIMLDNMEIKDIKKAVKLRNQLDPSLKRNKKVYPLGLPKIEVSGNVCLENVRQIAATGVDRISVGSLTHSAKSLDIALEIYG